jgi:hypothetical protein
MDRFNGIFQSLNQFWIDVGAFLPNMLVAIVLLIIGWIVAKLLRNMALRILRFLRIDVFAERSGIEDFLLKGGVRFTAVTLMAALIYWTILFIVFLAVLNTLGLDIAAELFNQVILYIPNVIVAIALLIFGTLFAQFVQSALFTYLSNIGVSGASLVSGIAKYAIIVFVVSISLEQLAIGGDILVSAFQIAFGALCLALALAFGLGGRDWAARVIDNASKKTK